MIRLILILLLAIPGLTWAELSAPLQSPALDVFDTDSLRRGVKLYAARCLGCHSLKHMRYRRLKEDLQLTDEELQDLFPGLEKVAGGMISAMPPEDAEKWFGLPTPDLSVRLRARGADWVYTFLRSFYQDDSRPFGVNNWVFKDVGMPHVLWDLQGLQKAVIEGKEKSGPIKQLDLITPGSLSPKEFDQAVNDLVNFLNYAAEPAQRHRIRLGKYVIFYLILLAFILYRLKKAYWKDIH